MGVLNQDTSFHTEEIQPESSLTDVIRKASTSSNESETEFLYDQNFYSLRASLLQQKNKLFEDPEFPPDNDLLRKRSERYMDEIEWLRPHEITTPEEPLLISNRNEGFDLRRGLDCWFVPAMSAIGESDFLLSKVVPSDQSFSTTDYAGIFHFRFWFGRWIDIVIDDRLPTRRRLPIYMKSNSSNEFWPALLEKAYAKAKGSYELLNQWMPIDGCIELTGGTPERLRNLNALLTPDARDANRLFLDLHRSCSLGNIILVSLPHKKSPKDKLRIAEATQLGLEIKFVYRVTQVANLGEGRQLIRVKNCYEFSSIFWVGAWSPGDSRWSSVPKDIKEDLEAETLHDGGFWMAYGDFLKYFKILDICHISHNVDQVVTFHGRWEIGLNAGGVRKGDFKSYATNPQCFIRLNDSDPRDEEGRSSAIISLMQRRKPESRAKGLNKIGFKVFKVNENVEELSKDFFSLRRNDHSHKSVYKTETWQDGRETNLRIRLPIGKYCIIPSTFDPDSEGDFILRVHIERYSREIENSTKSTQHSIDDDDENDNDSVE